MVAMTETLNRVAVHPGEFLDEALRDRGATRYVLSKHTGISQSALGDIIRGRRAITAHTALLLGRFFGTSPEFWLNLQMAYDLDLARRELAERLERVEPLGPREGS